MRSRSWSSSRSASRRSTSARSVCTCTRDARKAGESEERIYLLEAWRESPLYTERERAALAWTEALTLLPDTGAPDDVYALLAAQFSEPEIVNLTLAIGAINLWNRFGVGFRLVHAHKAPLVEA